MQGDKGQSRAHVGAAAKTLFGRTSSPAAVLSGPVPVMLSLFVAISVSLNARARLGTAVVRGLSRTAGAVMVVGAADIVGEVDNWRPEGGHGTGNRFMPLDTVRFPVAATPSPPPQHRARRRPHTTEQPFGFNLSNVVGTSELLVVVKCVAHLNNHLASMCN